MPLDTPEMVMLSKSRVKIVLVDGLTLVRAGLRSILAKSQGMEVLGECGTASAGLSMIRTHRPDVAVINARLPDDSAITLVRKLRMSGNDTPVLVLSAVLDEHDLHNALAAGAGGYVCGNTDAEDFIAGVRAVATGSAHFCPDAQAVLGAAETPAAVATELTAREREILTQVSQGFSNKQIARALNVSPKTVQKHRSNFMAKLMLHNTAQVTAYAIRHGMAKTA